MGAQVIYLQETHFKPSFHSKIKSRWIGHAYYSSFHSKSRGVAILLHKSVPFICSNVISDPNGRYLIVIGIMYDSPVLLVNIMPLIGILLISLGSFFLAFLIFPPASSYWVVIFIVGLAQN